MHKLALTPGRIILLLLVFLVSALVGMVVHLPAAWAWSQVESRLSGPLPVVSVSEVAGTVWDGVGLLGLQVPGLQEQSLRVSWDLNPLSLLYDEAGLGWDLQSPQSHLVGELDVKSTESATLNLEGIIALAEFSELARRNGLTLPGSITIDNLELGISKGKLVSANGVGRWDGGTVSWQMGAQAGQAEFPPLVAHLEEQQGGAGLDIVTEAGNEPLIHITLSPDGMMTMQVRRRLARISGLPAGSGPPDDIVFRMQQPLSAQ